MFAHEAGVRQRAEILRHSIGARRPTLLGKMLLELAMRQASSRCRQLAAEWALGPPRPLAAAPVVIVGLQRSGTTWLHHLMAADPTFWAPRFWELASPSRSEPRCRRRVLGHVAARAQSLLHPRSAAIHPIRAEAPEECWILFNHVLGARAYDFHLDLPELRAHLDAPENRKELYDVYRAQVELLAESASVASPRRVVLKCPDHLWSLAELVRVFPGVDLVWCRRDPVASLASFCSMTAMHRRTFFGAVDRRAVGRHVLTTFADGIHRAMRWRASQPHVRVHDLAYDELVGDPESMVAGLMDRLGAPLDGSRRVVLRRAIERTTAARGRHAYRLADWGLDEDEVRQVLTMTVSRA